MWIVRNIPRFPTTYSMCNLCFFLILFLPAWQRCGGCMGTKLEYFGQANILTFVKYLTELLSLYIGGIQNILPICCGAKIVENIEILKII